ncbi:Tubulin delta chain [Nymphon striatum]|nr:Tubulin delta chain [Nymphon striatum]
MYQDLHLHPGLIGLTRSCIYDDGWSFVNVSEHSDQKKELVEEPDKGFDPSEIIKSIALYYGISFYLQVSVMRKRDFTLDNKPMSIVTVQVGQCGNQLGEKFFQTLMTDINSEFAIKSNAEHEFQETALENFFIPIMVVEKAICNSGKSKIWKYSKTSKYINTKGSANNWANGFCIQGPLACEEVLNAIQNQAEKCDVLSGFLIPMSIAGGTGSGLGSFITEKIKDHFSKKFVMNQVVFPFTSGEVAIQNYNSVLTLSHLYPCSDMILFQENDTLQKICEKRLEIENPSLLNLNEVACHQLCSVLQPCQSNHNPVTLGDLIQKLSPTPNFKMVSIFNTPQESTYISKFNAHSWESLLKYLRQMLRTCSFVDDGVDWTANSSSLKSLTNLLILRGKKQSNLNKQLGDFENYTSYSSKFRMVSNTSVWSYSRKFLNCEKMATLVNNSQIPIPKIVNFTQKAWNMFNCQAYIHQYERYSLTNDEFINAFTSIEQIMDNYQNL